MSQGVDEGEVNEHLKFLRDTAWKITHTLSSKAADGIGKTFVLEIVDSAAFVREKTINVSDEKILRTTFFTSSGISFDVLPDYKVRGKVELVSWTDSELVVSYRLRFIPVGSMSAVYTLRGKYSY